MSTRRLSKDNEQQRKRKLIPFKGIWIPESGKFLLVDSRILDFGMRNTAVAVRNPTNNWNPESNVSLTRSGIQYLESGFL